VNSYQRFSLPAIRFRQNKDLLRMLGCS
ncbi:hypothetical protein GCK32_022264, partial [Trichostrongylus colubriformis]